MTSLLIPLPQLLIAPRSPTTQPVQIRIKGERGPFWSQSLVPCAIPVDPFRSSPLTSPPHLLTSALSFTPPSLNSQPLALAVSL